MALAVAVTGATGFVGQATVPALLAAGHRVRLLARRLPEFASGPAGPVEVVLGDLSQPGALERLVEGADAVLHMAGAIKARSAREFFAVNRDATAALLAAIARRSAGRIDGGPRVILLSSLAARAPQLSPYAASKRAGEDLLRATPHGLPWLAVRAPVVYGPGDRETLRFFKAVRLGLAPVAGDGSGRISAIFVDDLAALLCRLVEAYLPPADAYEVDDGNAAGYSLRDFAREAAAALGRRSRTVAVPRLAMSAAGAAQQGIAMLGGPTSILSPAKVREIFHPDWVCHDRRLAEFIGWMPTVGLGDGFARTIAWYRARGWL